MTRSAFEPNLPPNADTPDGQRFATQLREFVRAVLRSGVFLTRPTVSRRVFPGSIAADFSLNWGELNRVPMRANAALFLPRIAPENIGVPLEIIKPDTWTLTLVASGLGMDRLTRPQVQGGATATISAVGLYTLKNDGQDWYIGRAP